MGVYVDKVFGYTVDIQEEWEKLLENDKDNLIRDRWGGFLDDNDNSKFQYPERFVLYYELNSAKLSKPTLVTLVDDGMSGQYTKLVYILGFVRDSVENETAILDPLNEELAQVKADNSILDTLGTIYFEIFNCVLDTDRVHLELFNHFH